MLKFTQRHDETRSIWINPAFVVAVRQIFDGVGTLIEYPYLDGGDCVKEDAADVAAQISVALADARK